MAGIAPGSAQQQDALTQRLVGNLEEMADLQSVMTGNGEQHHDPETGRERGRKA
ncbi:hypothetical protein N184_11475 [Sinorhizobium sp. GL28]|nr:hypothetical protein N184_11475 [Sinorhizobium sp. GL28]